MYIDPKKSEVPIYANILTSCITPRPIAWISSLNKMGIANIAPYSFFTVASFNPPVLCVTQINPRDKAEKDTLANLKETKECVINVVNQKLVEKMNETCFDYPAHVSEFDAVELEPCASAAVSAPGVKAALVRFECSLREIISVSQSPSGGHMMLLNVVNIFIDDSLSHDSLIPEALDNIGKLGNDYYSSTREIIELARPGRK